MKKICFILKDGAFINLPGDSIDRADGWFRGWRGESVIAFIREEEVAYCYTSEAKNE